MITALSTEKPTLKSIIEGLRKTAAKTVMDKANGPEYFKSICNHIAPLVGLEPYQYWTLIDEGTRIREVIDIKHIAWTVIRSVRMSGCNGSYRQYPLRLLGEFSGNDHSDVHKAITKTFDLMKRNKEFARIYYQGLQKMIELCTG